jgi:hypothetical protein
MKAKPLSVVQDCSWDLLFRLIYRLTSRPLAYAIAAIQDLTPRFGFEGKGAAFAAPR